MGKCCPCSPSSVSLHPVGKLSYFFLCHVADVLVPASHVFGTSSCHALVEHTDLSLCPPVCKSDTEICLRPFVLRQSEVYRVAARMLMKSNSKTKPKPKQRELFLFLAISSALEVNLARFPILISDENLCERACRAHLSRL